MATRLGNDTAYVGTAYAVTRPGSQIDEAQVERLASDQASVYQTVANVNLAGGALSTLTPQVHDGTTGCLLSHPWGSWHIRRGTTETITGRRESDPPLVLCGSLDSDPSIWPHVICRWPVFVPAGHTQARVYLRGDEVLSLLCPVIEVSTTVTARADSVSPDTYGNGNRELGYTVSVTGGSVNFFSVLITSGYDLEQHAAIYSCVVAPLRWKAEGPACMSAPTYVDETQQIRATSFESIWDTATANGNHLPSYVTARLARNNGYLYELICGTPAPYYAAVTASGHDHDDADSERIDMPLLSLGLGCVELQASSGVSGLATGEHAGLAAPAFRDEDVTDYKDVLIAPLYCPAIAGGTTVTASWSAVVYNEEADNLRLILYSGATPNATTYSNEPSATSGTGWHHVSGTITLTDGALNFVRLDAKMTAKTGANDNSAITGLCVYLT